MLAVIKTGGKQYIVAPGQKIKIDPPASLREALRAGKVDGQEITFKEVLLLEKDNSLQIGAPFVQGAEVTAKVLRHGKGEKVVILKYKAKKRTEVKKGHRQQFIEVEVIDGKI